MSAAIGWVRWCGSTISDLKVYLVNGRGSLVLILGYILLCNLLGQLRDQIQPRTNERLQMVADGPVEA